MASNDNNNNNKNNHEKIINETHDHKSVYERIGYEAMNGFDARHDFFHCGQCGLHFNSLQEFVVHKLHKESMKIQFDLMKINGKLIKVPKLILDDGRNQDVDEIKDNAVDDCHNRGHNQINDESFSKRSQVKPIDGKQNPIVAIDGNRQNKKFYNCNECKKTFTQKARAFRHLQIVHNWDISSLPHCPEEPHDSSNSIKDKEACIEISVPPSLKRIECEKCGASIKGKRALKVHQLTHTEERKFCCTFDGCSFAFKTKGSMQRHMRRHTGERPFKCDLCGRTFRESGALTRHLKSRYICVHKSDADLPNYGKARALPTDSNIKELKSKTYKNLAPKQ